MRLTPLTRGRSARGSLVFVLSAFLLAAAACTGVRPATVVNTPAETQVAAEPLRVMTFNIRYGTAPDGNSVWQQRRPLTFAVIRDFAPVVLGVQEALRFQLDEIEQALTQYSEIGVGRDDGATKGEYSAILYDGRRLAVLEHGTFWLSDTPHVPGSMTWGNKFPRVVTWARFRDGANASTFYVFNTHWDHESQPARERSAKLILESIRARNVATDPVILMGDFNAGEDNPAFVALLATSSEPQARALRLYDTFRAVHPAARETGTFHAFRGDRNGAKIDAILVSPEWKALDAAVVLTSENGLYPSDHFPVTALLLALPPGKIR
jgi:endonuclease/exonuclease/phosphatase family metal-dependent hydrolase